jgi:hypothetical protein
MILTTEELNWINKRMDWYDIKYQEIYDEILDHILTGIEAARTGGDKRSIDIVFQQVVDHHFGGYLGIDNIVTAHEKAYRNRIGKTMLANYRYYINWQTIAMLVLLMIAGFYLPRNKPTSIILMCGLLVMAIVPFVYAFVKSRSIKTAKGKRSMVKGFVLTRSFLLVWLLSTLLNGLNLFKDEWHNPIQAYLYQPFIYMLFFFFFMIYGLSIVRLCKQEFKIPV